MKNKALHRSAISMLSAMQLRQSDWERNNLQFQSQDDETKREFYRAIDSLKAFCDNIS